jgi:hypothetical protein
VTSKSYYRVPSLQQLLVNLADVEYIYKEPRSDDEVSSKGNFSASFYGKLVSKTHYKPSLVNRPKFLILFSGGYYL